MPSLLSKVSSAAAACSRRVSRAASACARRLPRTGRRLLQRARRLRRDFSQLVPTTDNDHEQQEAAAGEEEEECGREEAAAEEEEVGGQLWRRTVLMGERCKPLDFPGAIHYDSYGRLLPAAPSPRSSRARALRLCRSACDVDEAATTARGRAMLAG